MLGTVTRDTETVLRLLEALVAERGQGPAQLARETTLLTALDEADFDLFAALAKWSHGD
jgi:hypothetical protein